MSKISDIQYEDFDIQAFKSRSTVVLTDTYPPFTHGGAEISLSICVNALPRSERKKIVIIMNAADQTTITSRFTNDVMVVRVPSSANFPFESHAKFLLPGRPLRKLLGEKNHTRSKIARRVLNPKDRDKVLLARKEGRTHPRGGICQDHLVGQGEFVARTYIKLVEMMPEFEILVSDNTRSILLGAKLMAARAPRKASVGIVRDNRFYCPRPTQSGVVKGRICQTTCAFECADIDAPKGPDIRRKALGMLHAYRKQALNSYSKVVTTSHQLVRYLQPVLDESTRLVRIPNGFGDSKEIDAFCVGRAQNYRDQLVIIGMLNENKGQIQFIKAATKWLKKHPSVQIILCGRGDRIANAVKKYAVENGISGQIKLAGFRSREDLFKILKESKLVLAPTVWPEPFGRVPLEAGIAQRAIVAFGVGGLNESIVDGKTGLLVKPGDYKRFLECIDELLANPATRLHMEKNARAHILKQYNTDKTADVFAVEVFQSAEILTSSLESAAI